MVLCLCNVIADRQIRRCVEAGNIRSSEDVFDALGCAPKCASCVPEIEAIVNAQQAACNGCDSDSYGAALIAA